MCLIHNIDSDTRISTAWLRNIYNKNSDGIGCMVVEDGKMVVKKYVPKNFKRALRWFRREVEGRAGIVHWRFATAGAVNMDNAHPFTVLTKEEDGVDLAMMHNGVVDFDAGSTLEDVYEGGRGARYYRPAYDITGKRVWDDRSDTYHMIRTLILPLVKPSLGGNPKNIKNPAVQALLNQFLGDSNKLVFMDGDGDVTYINGHVFVKWPAYNLYCSNTYAWAYEFRDTEDPDAAAAAKKQKLDDSKGDPRLQGKGSSLRASRSRARWGIYDDDDVEWSGLLLGHDTRGHAINAQSSMFADDLDRTDDPIDGATLADDRDQQVASDWADRTWDELNTVAPAVLHELTAKDLEDYYMAKGTTQYNVLMAGLLSGQITDMEFVDHILDALAPVGA